MRRAIIFSGVLHVLAVGLAYFGLPELFDPPMLEEVPSLSVDLVTQNEIAKMNPVKLQAPKKIAKKLPAPRNFSVPRLKKKNELKSVLKPKIVVKKPEPKPKPKNRSLHNQTFISRKPSAGATTPRGPRRTGRRPDRSTLP